MAKVTNLQLNGANTGLGSQLFKIASTIAVACQNESEFVFPYWEPWNHFKNQIPMFTTIDHKEVYNKIEDGNYSYMIFNDYEKRSSIINLVGNLQSHKYFNRYLDRIKTYFQPKETIEYFLKDKYKQFINKDACCAIHVNIDNATKDGKKERLTMPDYYNGAIQLMKNMNKVENMIFFVFSDNIELAKMMFGTEKADIYYVHELNHVFDFFLMSMFKNIIISNSSFAWWSAYISEYKTKKVVAPAMWYDPKYSKVNPKKDLYQEGWRVI